MITMTEREMLVDQVLNQIEKDVKNGDFSAIEELLENVPDLPLKAYLPEDL